MIITQIASTVVLLLCSIKIATLVNSIVPEPYMDEIFHIPQAQRYCNDGIFNAQWDDKITTLPGLYIVSLPFMKLASLLSKQDQLCSTYSLRSMNIVFICMLFTIITMILSSNKKTSFPVYKSFQLTTLPLLYFFTSLYYTDIGATLFLIISFYFAKKEKYTISALSSSIAVLFRQTNIIWIFWIALNTLVEWFEKENKNSSIPNFIIYCVKNIHLIVTKLYGYIIVAISFVIFVFINGGLVVGDKTNHIAITHIPQVLYFFAFTMLFMIGEILVFLYQFVKNKKNILDLLRNIWLPLVIGIPIAAFVSLNYSYVHMFLLSDNRHYLFYLWRKLFHIHIRPGQIPTEFAIMYSPLYVLSMIFVYYLMKKYGKKSSLSIFCFFICVCLNLIPLPLIEFRYFIVPFIMLNLLIYTSRENVQIDFDCNVSTFINIIFYNLINMYTLYRFLYKPFTAPDGSVARMMW